jgi:hypothetical protein
LIATAAVGACAVATPFVIEKGAELGETEVKALLQHEIGTLEGIALEDALKVAELTRKVVQYIVVPLARFVSGIEGDAIQGMITSLTPIKNLADRFHISIPFLDGFLQLLTTWHANISLLPISLQAYANADINGAEAYLRALQAKVSSNSTTPV